MSKIDWNSLLAEYNKLTCNEIRNVKSLLKMSLRVDFTDSETKNKVKEHMIRFEHIESEFAQLFQSMFFFTLFTRFFLM